MAIKDVLVYLDPSPATEHRLEAAMMLAKRLGAHVTVLHLIAEPFLRGGHHLPADIMREHMAHAEAEAEGICQPPGRPPSGRVWPRRRARERLARPAADPPGPARAAHRPHRDRPARSGDRRGQRHGADRGRLHGQWPPGLGHPARRYRHHAAAPCHRRLGRLARGGPRRDRCHSVAAAGRARPGHDRRRARPGGRPAAQLGERLALYLRRHAVKAELRHVSSGGGGITELLLAQPAPRPLTFWSWAATATPACARCSSAAPPATSSNA